MKFITYLIGNSGSSNSLYGTVFDNKLNILFFLLLFRRWKWVWFNWHERNVMFGKGIHQSSVRKRWKHPSDEGQIET